MASCPAYATPICSLCCTLEALPRSVQAACADQAHAARSPLRVNSVERSASARAISGADDSAAEMIFALAVIVAWCDASSTGIPEWFQQRSGGAVRASYGLFVRRIRCVTRRVLDDRERCRPAAQRGEWTHIAEAEQVTSGCRAVAHARPGDDRRRRRARRSWTALRRNRRRPSPPRTGRQSARPSPLRWRQPGGCSDRLRPGVHGATEESRLLPRSYDDASVRRTRSNRAAADRVADCRFERSTPEPNPAPSAIARGGAPSVGVARCGENPLLRARRRAAATARAACRQEPQSGCERRSCPSCEDSPWRACGARGAGVVASNPLNRERAFTHRPTSSWLEQSPRSSSPPSSPILTAWQVVSGHLWYGSPRTMVPAR